MTGRRGGDTLGHGGGRGEVRAVPPGIRSTGSLLFLPDVFVTE